MSWLLPFLKVLVMVIFFLIVMFCGTLPIRSRTFKRKPLLVAIGSTFAGCLFLNVAIMHILPQAADTLQEYLKDKSGKEEVFPLAYLLLMVGFIITVFFTKVMAFHTHQDDHDEQADFGSETTKVSEGAEEDGDQNKNQNQQLRESLISEKGQQSNQKEYKKVKKSKTLQTEHLGDKKGKVKHSHSADETHHEHNHQHQHSNEHEHQQLALPEPSHHHHHLQNKSMLNEAFILTLAIYFHTIFQGIAVGVQSNISDFLSTAVAIGFHKWADALSMGCHYKSKNVQKKISYWLIIGQAVLNVLSIGLGWIISASGEVTEAVFLSISAGTFLAISTLELLGEQLHHKKYMGIKFGLLIGATVFVASIWFIENAIFTEN